MPTLPLPALAVPALIAALAFAASAASHDVPGTGPMQGGVSSERIAEIARLLPEEPFAFGPKIEDREAWARLAKEKAFANVIRDAEKLAATPMPPMSEDVYLEYKRTGERTKHYGQIRSARHGRIETFTLAECIENKGRFLKPLQDAIADICTEPTWVYNFHDPKLEYWHGKYNAIDLGSILPAHDMAECLYLLGDRLSPQTRQLMTDNVRRRILDPYRRAVNGADEPWRWWILSEANWNAVCHFGVLGAALEFGKDRQDRAFFVAAAEKYLQNYLRGFGPDGYCAEGMGYWGYGYGNYVHLSELVLQATRGQLNFYDLPGAKLVAMYPPRLEIQNGVWPAYADCALGTKPGKPLMAFLNRHYHLGLAGYDVDNFATTSYGLAGAMLYSNPNSATQAPPASDEKPFYELRTFFDHGGVLTCRPRKDSDCKLAVSLKGGNNDEPHNHNDLGTFVVVLKDQSLILDPGGEVYNARTFSKDRYQSNLLNSFGHPVPVVAGQLQCPGKDAVARTLSTHFTDAEDRYVMDLSSAYPVKELKKLTRSFTYSRQGAGSLVVRDDYAFSSPQSFGGALITYGSWKQLPSGDVLISQNGQAVNVHIDSAGVPFELKAETIKEHTHTKDQPTRIGINLTRPTASGSVTLTITPATPADAAASAR